MLQYWGLLALGYLFGNSFGGNLGQMVVNAQYVLGGAGLLLGGYYVFTWYMRRQYIKEEEEMPGAHYQPA